MSSDNSVNILLSKQENIYDRPESERGNNKNNKSNGNSNNGNNLRLHIARIRDTHNRSHFIDALDRMLVYHARQITGPAGIDYNSLNIHDRLLLTRFRCSLCGDLPFYFLDTRHVNRMRCGKCSGLISLKNTGKYGRFRKMIAISACRQIDGICGNGTMLDAGARADPDQQHQQHQQGQHFVEAGRQH